MKKKRTSGVVAAQLHSILQRRQKLETTTEGQPIYLKQNFKAAKRTNYKWISCQVIEWTISSTKCGLKRKMQWLTFNSLDFVAVYMCCAYVSFWLGERSRERNRSCFLKRCKTASNKLVEGGDATIYDLMLGSPSSLLEEEGNATVYWPYPSLGPPVSYTSARQIPGPLSEILNFSISCNLSPQCPPNATLWEVVLTILTVV